ncbi:arylalkylamine N-acetyltransferase 1-like isoform X1 [Wyeomyia smithii]|uniref:arylalkylamine N-acetyltransferase 1-like isoform X1 n=1 Tax=Wyeomyia smithii TaxID=174621 RepID=UPI002467C792|nr:arylalkylamine N-acetyltransferase 1-like isoform X1 [Wyeomyia smithii]
MFRKTKIFRYNLPVVSGFLQKCSLNLVGVKRMDSCFKAQSRALFSISKHQAPRPFSIRLAKAQDEVHILHFIRESFFSEEPLLKSLKVTKAVANPCLEAYMYEHLKDGFSLIAVEPDNRIVGVALNQRNCEWEGDKLRERADLVQSDPLRKLYYIWSIISREPRLHKKFNTSCIFEIAILATAREAQRRGIGYQLTVRSLHLARDMGYDVARMDCTNEYSSRLAQRAGMECMWSVPYKHLVDSTKKPVVQPEVPHTHIRVHAIQLRKA